MERSIIIPIRRYRPNGWENTSVVLSNWWGMAICLIAYWKIIRINSVKQCYSYFNLRGIVYFPLLNAWNSVCKTWCFMKENLYISYVRLFTIFCTSVHNLWTAIHKLCIDYIRCFFRLYLFVVRIFFHFCSSFKSGIVRTTWFLRRVTSSVIHRTSAEDTRKVSPILDRFEENPYLCIQL